MIVPDVGSYRRFGCHGIGCDRGDDERPRGQSSGDELKQENASLQASLNSNVATMTAQTSQAAANESQVMDTVLKLQQASYELAQPDNISLVVRSPYAGSSSQGILLLSSGGSRGVIIVAAWTRSSRPPTITFG